MKEGFRNFKAAMQYGDYYRQAYPLMQELLAHYQAEGKKVAIWGAGLKGISFLKVMDPKAKEMQYVIDKNEKLHYTFLQTGHKITSDQILEQEKIDVVFVINEKYLINILSDLKRNHFKGKVLSVDKIVKNKNLNLSDILSEDFAKEEEEVYINGITLRQVQEQVLEILVEVDRICRENKIKYVLEAGSALGAEKKKGFLICDNDADIAMLRDDYETFLKIAPKTLKAPFLLQRLDKNSKYPYPYAQVVKDGTCYVRYKLEAIRMHHGIHIDIAPLDKVPEEKEERERQIERVRKWTERIYKKFVPEIYMGRNPLKKVIVNYEYYLYKWVPRSVMEYYLNRAFTQYNGKESNRIGDLCTHYEKDVSFPTEWLFPSVYKEFEKKSFPVPAQNEKYLEIMYDSYKEMTPSQNGYSSYMLLEVSLEHNYTRRQLH